MVVIGRQVDLCESEASLVCMVAPCSMFPCRRQEEEAGVWVMGLEMGAEVGRENQKCCFGCVKAESTLKGC